MEDVVVDRSQISAVKVIRKGKSLDPREVEWNEDFPFAELEADGNDQPVEDTNTSEEERQASEDWSALLNRRRTDFEKAWRK